MLLQDMPRRWARRCLAIPRFCRQTLEVELKNSRLIIAYSTGLDSTALLHIFHALAPQLNLELIVAHAHHGLRPQSDQELIHAQKICAQLNIPCETAHLQVLHEENRWDHGLEDYARQLRYAFLQKIRDKYQAHWIVTAHHGDDLAEDIIMRLIRGTGWPGLGGMVGKDEQRQLLRPLLDWKKTELHALAQDLGLSWHEDLSNTSLDLTRNRVRHQIMPLIAQENPSFTQASLRLWHMARIDEAYWEAMVSKIQPGETIFLERKMLQAAHPALRLRLFKRALDTLGPGQVLADQLFLVEQCWQDQAWGKTIQFSGHKICRIEQKGITISPKNRPSSKTHLDLA
ncbi:MAG: tRNA lysidine(34) synthetase TilS [Desulfomicrobium sp.]|nr:tRNA lysidine(34) synthetase TilS [Desulfomicrobium sp.]